MILNALVERLKRRSKDDFKGACRKLFPRTAWAIRERRTTHFWLHKATHCPDLSTLSGRNLGFRRLSFQTNCQRKKFATGPRILASPSMMTARRPSNVSAEARH
jgi:hypothetical protein